MGAQGVMFASKDSPEPKHVSSPTVTAVDSTGAGDAFVGALAYLLANNKSLPLKHIVEGACYVASQSCTKLGTQDSYPEGPIIKEYLTSKCACGYVKE